MTILPVIFEGPNVLVPIGIGIDPLAILFVISPVAHIFIAAGRQCQSAVTGPFTKFERPNILVAVGMVICALAIEQIIFKRANICVAIREGVNTLPLLSAIFEITFVTIPIRG